MTAISSEGDPSARQVAIHAAFGLRSYPDGVSLISRPTENKLSRWWLAMDDDAQVCWTADFLVGATSFLFDRPDAMLQADLPLPYDKKLAVASAVRHSVAYELVGPTFAASADWRLLKSLFMASQIELQVMVGGAEKLFVHDDADNVFLHLSSEELRALRARVESLAPSRPRRRN